ncbi:MAG: GMC oxidoreductase [Nitrospirae bacterium]|nr:GMC oxidoreductase [Nitrospirota bacterium]
MLVDARSLPGNKTIETDVCIVGTGVAGITLSREFIGKGFRVCLLESGGLRPDRAMQSLFWGENIGHPYFPLDTARTCGFGGTSHRWGIRIGDDRLGVRLRPLDEIDFEERDWVPYSGWPFKKSHLDPFYERAQSICQIGPFTYDVKDWEDTEKTPRLAFADGRVKTTIFQFGPRDSFIRDYREEIIRAENITAYVHASVVEIETDKTAQTVTRLRVACLQGKNFRVAAKLYILAMGAIETPRLLLLSNKVQKTGLGNENDLVGRFFMEHPHLWSGTYIPSDPHIARSTALYNIHTVNRIPIMGKLTLSEEVLRSEKLLNYCVSIHPKVLQGRPDIAPSWPVVSWPLLSAAHPKTVPNQPGYQKAASDGIDSLKVLSSAIRCGDVPHDFGKHLRNVITDIDDVSIAAYRKVRRKCVSIFNKFKKSKRNVVFQLDQMSEQAPNPQSRVTLADERDILGRNRVRLDWQMNPLDIHTIVRAQEIIDEELRRAGLGRLQIELHGDTPPSNLEGGWHHMGTTRMHKDPLKGVVDENCKVYGRSNLFIAGPSVFPTSGYANPVLTIVALALRLSGHIKKLME